MRRLASVAIACLLVFYPLAVYLGLNHLTPAKLGLFVAVIGALRVLFVLIYRKNITSVGKTVVLAGLLMVAGLTFALTGREASLKLYPVALNLVMLTVFSLSLTTDRPFVERVARLHKPDLPDHAVPYLRKVTIAWCFFFLLNGTIAYWSAIYASREFWALYNGLIAYMLVGSMFAFEFIVRHFMMKRHGAHSQGVDPAS